VLVKYGFGEFLYRAHLPLYVKTLLKRRGTRGLAGPEQLRLALEELGPTFIKFGQILSTRAYLLPSDYGAELAKLQDQVSPFAFEEVERIITTDLGGSLSSLFKEFDREPLASASIAQVHMATLAGGERVCVKVQRPGVREAFAIDTMILRDLASLLETYVPESRRYDPSGIVSEFERTSRREVDFSVEASHIAAFAKNFAGDPEVQILQVYKALSTSRVLTTEFIDGIKISEIDRLKAASLNTAEIARAGARAVLRQIFEFGLFHADPHPGNLFVTRDGKIAPVDFGIVGRLTKREISDLADVFIGVVEGNEQRIISGMERLRMLPEDVERRDVLEEVMLFSEKYGSRRLGEINVRDLFGEIIAFMRRYRVKVRTEFLLLGKALSIYEEVGRVLDPDFSMMEEAKPYVGKLLGRRRIIAKLLGEPGRAVGEAVSKLSSIPSDLANILALARQGRLKLEFEHMGLEKLTGEIEKASNRLSFSLLVAALIVASSLVLVRGGDIAVYRGFGIAGFAIAALVGLWLLINILRSGRV